MPAAHQVITSEHPSSSPGLRTWWWIRAHSSEFSCILSLAFSLLHLLWLLLNAPCSKLCPTTHSCFFFLTQWRGSANLQAPCFPLSSVSFSIAAQDYSRMFCGGGGSGSWWSLVLIFFFFTILKGYIYFISNFCSCFNFCMLIWILF